MMRSYSESENPIAESSSESQIHLEQEREQEDDDSHKWVALKRSPTYHQARISLFKTVSGDVSQVDITKLGKDDPELFFTRLRQRFVA